MSDDWLHRLDAAGWLAAAHAELDACARHLDQRRTAVAHARRAGGMALNAVLVAWVQKEPGREQPWGRSYVDHLRAVADGVLGPLEAEARELALAVLATPMGAPALIVLGKRNAELDTLLERTRALTSACARAVDRLSL